MPEFNHNLINLLKIEKKLKKIWKLNEKVEFTTNLLAWLRKKVCPTTYVIIVRIFTEAHAFKNFVPQQIQLKFWVFKIYSSVNRKSFKRKIFSLVTRLRYHNEF